MCYTFVFQNYKIKEENLNAAAMSYLKDLLQESIVFFEENLKYLDISEYKYDISEAVEELALDEETIFQLVEDYVIQILKSNVSFLKFIVDLKDSRSKAKFLDYTPIRNLAHKNLGVARNLRIKDAIKVLEIMMKEQDLESLELCVKALECCAIRLNPKVAHDTIKLIKVKNSL